MFENILLPEAARKFIAEQRKPPEAVRMPFPTWNYQCRGAGGRVGPAFGWHILLAGKVNQGKTGMMLNLVDSIIKSGHSAAVFSMEMSLNAIQYRLYPILTGIHADSFERGRVDEDAAKNLEEILRKILLGEAPKNKLFVNSEQNRNLNFVMSEMERLHEEQQVRVFLIDYLQLMRMGGNEAEERHRVAEISARLFQFAHEKSVLTVGLSQFARVTTRDGDNKPAIEGMYGSSSLEADADQVLLLDHTRYMKDPGHPHLHRTWLLLAKNRHGGKGDIPFEWDWRTFTTREAMADEVGDWPGCPDELKARSGK